jgi:hypothetical protein
MITKIVRNYKDVITTLSNCTVLEFQFRQLRLGAGHRITAGGGRYRDIRLA